MGKQNQHSFDIDKGILDLVHVDLHGPMKTPTMLGTKYFQLLVDVFSRKIWVCFPNKKSIQVSNFVVLKHSLRNKQENMPNL